MKKHSSKKPSIYTPQNMTRPQIRNNEPEARERSVTKQEPGLRSQRWTATVVNMVGEKEKKQ